MATKKKQQVKKAEDVQVIDYREVGATGLRRFSGFIFEEFLLELTGWKGVAVYKEMSQNDATVAGVLFAIRMLCRRVPWRVEPASTQPYDQEAADFVDTCMNDMSQNWVDTVDEILSMIVYGYSVHEIVYKRRCGDVFDPTMRSKHSDGRIGWRKLPIRSQDTIYRWQFDDHGGIQGVEQLAPPHYHHVTIPVEKMLLFRTQVTKNNPEGKSLLRGAYRSWYNKKFIENIEGIGIERDLAGLPCALVPAELLSTGASQDQKNLLASIKDIVINIRRDAQEGVVFPMVYDTNGKSMYELKLLSTGGQRQFDTDKIINRYDQRIAMTMLADFLFLGQNNVGSFALVDSRTNLFSTAIGAVLDMVSDVMNRFALPRLFELNDFKISEHPKITHGDLEAVDLDKIGKYINSLATAGFPLFPNDELEKWLMKVGNMPEPPDPLKDPEMHVQPQSTGPDKKVVEVPGSPAQSMTGLAKPSDTTPVNQKPPVQNPVVTNQLGSTERNSFTDNRKVTEDSLKDMKRGL